MSDTNETRAALLRSTVFLPKTDFPMKAGLPAKEPGILARWQAMDVYGQLRQARAGREKFILHDGPPYANGDMHIGHALNHILKDMVVRTQSLLGKDAPYVPGWDCHGLPIEWKVEEAYRKKKLNKDDVPVAEFRAECRAYAQTWVNTQREQLKRLGIGGNWDKPYLTMDFDAEATIVAELLKFAESGQLYRGAKPVMWSPVEKTALAEAEVEYEDITSTQIDVAFEIIEAPNAPQLVGAYAVIWTTTPWTIPVNQAIAYGAEVEYCLVGFGLLYDIIPGAHPPEHGNPEIDGLLAKRFVVATELVGALRERLESRVKALSETQGIRVQVSTSSDLWRGKGSALVGAKARHPMHTLHRHPGEGRGPDLAAVGAMDPGLRRDDSFFDRPRPFLDGSSFVTTDSGTGLVHMAPDHGEDDFFLCKANGIDPVFAVTAEGKYRNDWAWLGGQGSVINPKFNAPDGPICSDLAGAGCLLAASADYRHSYPHSWRSKAKVIYRCTPQWFVPMDKAVAAPSVASGDASTGRGGLGAASPPPPGEGDPAQQGGGGTLRQSALAAISATRWVPAKGENRIRAMVEGRPDWVLSRQRAWGVPITLFVNRATGQYLNDPAVNARIIAAVREKGVDAWTDEAAQDYLGPDYQLADYERVTDILDVWFDSGCTHAFVLESGKWPELSSPADLYLEGSDQHRGWFQSSLLQSCGTRGRAPYKAVLTHGFTMASDGRKMSKSLGNTIDPVKVMEDYGADIIRLWALSVDFTEDHRIGKDILAGVADQYRKLRNTFRYLLGALDGFGEAERLAVEAMPELERYMLALLADLDGKLRAAIEAFDFNSYVRLLSDFANDDLSAFFFDIRKDSLYCDGADHPRRRAYRTVLDILFHALVRWAAPVLVFTAEEVWGSRYPEGGSVHLLEWPDFEALLSLSPPRRRGSVDEAASMDSGLRWNDKLIEKYKRIRDIRESVTGALEGLRRDKVIGASLEGTVALTVKDAADAALIASIDFAELCIAGNVDVTVDAAAPEAISAVRAERTTYAKCARCWRHLPDVGHHKSHPDLCERCADVVDHL